MILDTYSMSNVELRAYPEPAWRGVSLYLRAESHGEHIGDVYATGEVTMTPVIPGSRPPSMVVIEERAAQTLMDDLWRCGLRPSEGSGSAGALAATERHLKDMQTVAMKAFDNVLLRAEKPLMVSVPLGGNVVGP